MSERCFWFVGVGVGVWVWMCMPLFDSHLPCRPHLIDCHAPLPPLTHPLLIPYPIGIMDRCIAIAFGQMAAAMVSFKCHAMILGWCNAAGEWGGKRGWGWG